MDLLGILRIKDSNGNWVSVPGLKGDTGEPFKILGIYATAAALEAAVTDPEYGDVYLVGSVGAYDIYLYLADGWHNTGRYMPKGDQGDPAPAASITSAVETWLAANVDPETGYVLDRTLSANTAAAPADLVGDIKESVDELKEKVLEEKTESGTRIVISDGISNATLKSEVDQLPVMHTGKNLLDFPYYYSGTRTVNGVQYTFNDDGTIDVVGTATANARTDILNTAENSRKPIKAGTYTFSNGKTPYVENQGFYSLIITGVGQYYLSGTGNNPTWNSGITVVIPNDTTYGLAYQVSSGNTANVKLTPQLELGNVQTEWEQIVRETIDVDTSGTQCELFEGINVFTANNSFTATYYADAEQIELGVYNLKQFGAVGDGQTDDTESIKTALTNSKGKILLIPEGTYLFSETLHVKSGTHIIGCGESSVFKLANSFSLDSYTWRADSGRQYQSRYPLIVTDEDSEGCILENFALIGQTATFKDENEDGICLRGSNHIAQNLSITKINYFPSSFSGRQCITPAWGIVAFNAENILISNCDIDECGYECIGIENASNIAVKNCKTGIGNQTSVQIHRNSHHCKIEGCSMLKSSSCMTMDADPAQEMTDIHIENNYIQGVVNFVAGGENSIFIVNNYIGSGVNCNNAVYRKLLFLRGNRINGRVGTYHDEAMITDNIIKENTGYYMIIHHGNKSVIANNLGIGTVTDILNLTHE